MGNYKFTKNTSKKYVIFFYPLEQIYIHKESFYSFNVD
jgi:hypothetical protein